MHSCATVVIPLYDGVVFVGALNRTELVRWFSEIAQTLDAIREDSIPSAVHAKVCGSSFDKLRIKSGRSWRK
jgi:hypothetical protein